MVRHMTDHNHKLNFNHIKILHSERDWNKRLVSEMLYIDAHIDSINVKTDFRGLNDIYSPIG